MFGVSMTMLVDGFIIIAVSRLHVGRSRSIGAKKCRISKIIEAKNYNLFHSIILYQKYSKIYKDYYNMSKKWVALEENHI